MAHEDWWWDDTWNPTGGCKPLSHGCDTCWSAQDAPLQIGAGNPLYAGTTDLKDGRHEFNGTLREWRPGYPLWTFPLHWPGARHPKLGLGMPSLLWACATSELFLPGRPIDRTIGTLVISPHIGLILTKLPSQMVPYITAQPAISQQRWRKKLWLGFSAEDQFFFDKRWPLMRPLAEQGWLVFVSIAPMIGPVRLPDDFLKLGRWVICSGEEGPNRYVRPMNHAWPRAVRDQCAAAGIPFFLKQMAGKKPIPPDLLVPREFPAW